MTSKKEFDKILLRLASANAKYKTLLDKAESIFEERYGQRPSDVDFDSWIDVYHSGIGYLSSDQIESEIEQVGFGLTVPDKQ